MKIVENIKKIVKKIFGKKYKELPETTDERIEHEDVEKEVEKIEKEIQINLEEKVKLKIDKNPIKGYVKNGKERDDRKVEIKAKDGTFRRSSNIMLGYNKDNFRLPNGEYVDISDIDKALDEALKINPKENENIKIKCKKTNKFVDIEDVKREIMQLASKNAEIKIGAGTDKITNQETATVFLRQERKEFLKKGVLMLGNGKISLPHGEYISKKEIEEALKDYVFSIETVTEKSKGDEKVPVRSTKKRWKLWPLVTAAVATLALGFNIRGMNEVNASDLKGTEKVINYETTYEADYSVQEVNKEKTKKLVYEEVKEKVLKEEEKVIDIVSSQFEIGKTVYVPEGVIVHGSSDYTQPGASNTMGTYGKNELLITGPAKIEYISLIDENGNIAKVMYDNSEYSNVEEFINKAKQENHFNEETGKIMVHIGGVDKVGNYVQAGWTEKENLIIEDNVEHKIQPAVYEEEIVRKPKYIEDEKETLGEIYEGTQKEFNNMVTILDENKQVNIPITQNTKEGDRIKASNGKEYIINDIDIYPVFDVIDEVIIDENSDEKVEENQSGIEVEWNVRNIKARKALAKLFAILGVGGFGIVNRDKFKRKDDEESDLEMEV